MLLYLESVANPRKFARLARRIASRKPILAVKSGRSTAGARATSSHTGALISASDVTVDALFEQAGVIRADTLHELFDVASLLTKQPVPRGERVAIVTNGGGPGIMCADACQANGVAVPSLPAEVAAQLLAFLPAAASVANPVDMLTTATAEDYRHTLRVLLDDDAVDAIVVIFVPPRVTQGADIAAAIRETAAGSRDVTIAAVFMTSAGPPPELAREDVRVPAFAFPEDAARAVALAARHGRWRARPEGRLYQPADARPEQAAAIISVGLAQGAGWLSTASATALLDTCGLPLITTRVVGDGDEAAAVAAELGSSVALKASARGLLRKSAIGGVRLGLEHGSAIRAAAHEIQSAVAAAGHELDGLIVQQMAPAGIELIIGVVNDHNFGPVLAIGPGGTAGELAKDVTVWIMPVTDLDAHDMLCSSWARALLAADGGALSTNVKALEDLLLRVSALVEAHPEIVELDLNPVISRPDCALILDARVRIEQAPLPIPMPSLTA